MRESRVRGGVASWPSLAAVAVCGGFTLCENLPPEQCLVRGAGHSPSWGGAIR